MYEAGWCSIGYVVEKNFVFATLAFAHLVYVTLEFDISLFHS
uniref:Uncharacterized protein n=1 Tax=Aegilops tauschii subsp. strangulata TaxID=200361 RepID=A0A452XQK8_AEGTS